MKRKMTTFWRILRTGVLYFVRNAWLAIAAMATMIITLTIVLFSMIVNATFSNTIQQITNKIDISVYLTDSATAAQTTGFIHAIKQQSGVRSVVYLDKAAALKAFMTQNANNEKLLAAVNGTNNPLPATIQIKPKNLNEIETIRSFVTQPKWVALQSDPVSDNGDMRETINKITHATDILRKVGIIAVAVFALISVLIIFNTIQMAIFNRRDELQIMRLLGASTSYIRGPFVVETIVYGVISAVSSILIVNALFITASSSLQTTSFGLLDIGYSQHFFEMYYWRLLFMQLMLGILIGAASSVIATQRYLKFKTKRTKS